MYKSDFCVDDNRPWRLNEHKECLSYNCLGYIKFINKTQEKSHQNSLNEDKKRQFYVYKKICKKISLRQRPMRNDEKFCEM